MAMEGLKRLLDGNKVNKKDIVEYAAREHLVEQCIETFRAYEARNNPNYETDLEDLSQDIYLYLMTRVEPMKLYEIYSGGKLKDYIFLMVKQNIQSVNSRYYYMYKKKVNSSIPIEDYETKINKEDDENYDVE